MTNRRTFIKQGLAAGTGLALFPYFTSFKNNKALPGRYHPDGLVPFAIMDDVSGCIQDHGSMDTLIKEALKINLYHEIPANFSRMGLAFPPKPPVIKKYVQEITQNRVLIKKDEFHAKKLAFTLGWLITYAIDTTFARVCTPIAKDEPENYAEMQLYQDAYLINHLSDNKPKNSDVENLTSLFMAMFPRMIGRIHTLKPDVDDGNNWVLRMTEYRKENKQTLERLANIIDSPDEQKQIKYVFQLPLYKPKEINPLKRGIKAGNSNRSLPKQDSLYGKAISKAYEYLLAFDGYFKGKNEFEVF